MDSSSAEEFVRLFSKSQHRILGFVHTLVPNLGAAEDILQETSLILWKMWPEFERDRDFVKWACGIARFEVFRMLRQNRRGGLYLSDTVLNQIADIALAESHDRRHIEASGTALEECLKELDKPDQEILQLRYRQELTIVQIAELCKHPKSTVHDMLERIRARLLRCVKRRLEA